jgi:hypothetical protein
MRSGITLYIKSYQDWDRYEAAEQGESVPPLDPQLDAKLFTEELEAPLKLESLGFDSIWTVEHHISPYTMITNPIQLLTFFAGAYEPHQCRHHGGGSTLASSASSCRRHEDAPVRAAWLRSPCPARMNSQSG